MGSSKPYKPDTHMSPHLLFVQMFRTFRWCLRSTRRLIHELGYTDVKAEHFILMACLDEGNITIAELKKRLHYSFPLVCEMVRSFEILGYIQIDRQKTTQSQDGCSCEIYDETMLVSYTDKGLELFDDVTNSMALADITLSQRIGSSRVSTLKRMLSCDWGNVLTTNEIELNAEVEKRENRNLGL